MGEVVRLVSSRERPVVRACNTCAHRPWRFTPLARCKATAEYVNMARQFGPCGKEGLFWEPRKGALARLKTYLFGEGENG